MKSNLFKIGAFRTRAGETVKDGCSISIFFLSSILTVIHQLLFAIAKCSISNYFEIVKIPHQKGLGGDL